MRPLSTLLPILLTLPLQAQWTTLGDMPQPARAGDALRFENAQAAALITPLSPEVIRVRIMPGGESRDHSYAVVDRNLGGAAAALDVQPQQSTITTSALRVTIRHAPFSVAFATRDGASLDEDDRERGIAISGTASRVWKRLRDDEHVYGFGEKNGPLDKRGWKLGGYSYTMWNSDTYAYDASTDPLYASVPFYMVLRGGVAHGIFLDNTFRSNFDIGHQSEGLLSFGADGGELDYYFIYGPEPKQVIERYTALTGRMPLPPLWSLGYHQCRWSYYPESRVRFIAGSFRERRIPADVIWLDIHYQDRYRPFTWDKERFPDPAKLIGDLRRQGFRVVTTVDPHPPRAEGYAPYRSGVAGNHFVKNAGGSLFEGKAWPSQAEGNLLSVYPDYSRAETRRWWGDLHEALLRAGVAGIWNDMNEPAVLDVVSGTMPLDVRHHNEGAPTDHREVHNVYGMLMTQSTFEGLRRLRPEERPFVLTRATFAGGQRYAAIWPGDNVSDWTALRGSIPMLLGLGLSGFPFAGADIGGFVEAPTAELFTRWIQAGVFYPFMRTHTSYGTPDQEPWSYGNAHEALNRSAIELRYQLLPHIYSAMREASETGVPAMRPMMLEFPHDPRTYGMDDQFLFGSDILVAPVLRAGVTTRGVYLPAGEWYDYRTGRRHDGGRWITVPVTLASIPIFIRGGAVVFEQPVVQHTGEMAGQPLIVSVFPGGSAERWLYEDAGNGFEYERGVYARRRFSSRVEDKGMILEISAPEGTYRPPPRSMILRVRTDARPSSVSVEGWTYEEGVVAVELPDRFERTEVRILR